MLGVTTSIVQDKRIKKNDGTFAIKLRLTFNRKQYYIPIGYHLTPEDWEMTQSPKAKRQHKTWRYRFMEIEKHAEAIVEGMANFSIDHVRKELFKLDNPEADLLSLMSRYLDDLRREERYGSANSFDSSLKSFKKFGTDGKRKRIPLEVITVDWLKRYEKWMLDQGKSPTTTGIYLRNLRTVFNIAIEEGLVSRKAYPFGKRKYQIPAGKKVKKALTLEQIKKIVDYKATIPAEERARDLWLFSYLCNGVNVKDIALLRYRNIDGDRIVFIRAKTERSTKHEQEPVVVYLLPQALEIIRKWGRKPAVRDSFVFDLIDPKEDLEKQRAQILQAAKTINKYMDRIGKHLELPMKVTTYTARHSYATILKRSGATTEFISESLGHKDLKTTENYLDSFESDVKREFQKKLLNFSA